MADACFHDSNDGDRPETDSYVCKKRTFNLRVAPKSLVANVRDDRNACQWIG